MEFNIDTLIGTSVGNKHTDKVDTRLYEVVMGDFTQLKNMWSKSFAIFLLERSGFDRLKNIGAKIHLEIKFLDESTYDRFIRPYIQELKRSFIASDFHKVKDHIVEAYITHGETEYIIIHRMMFNCSPELYWAEHFSDRASFLINTLKKIETHYDTFKT